MKKLICMLLFSAALFLSMSACLAPNTETPSDPPAESTAPATPSPQPGEAEPSPSPAPAALPDFLIDFDFDRADWLDVNENRDYRVCLMDESESASLCRILDMDSWTETGEIPAMGLEPPYILYDHAGNSLTAVRWEGDTCLILAANNGIEDGSVYRYLAPLSVLEDYEAFVAGLTPLPGTVSTEKELYYELFRQDSGTEALIALASPDGAFTEEQITAYASARIADYNFDFPNSTSAFDAVTLRHFDRTVSNIEAVDHDFVFGSYLVLDRECIDGNGVITAQFKCYHIPDSVFTDKQLPSRQLNHVKEHLLTGNDEGFPDPVLVKITFEIRFNIETQTSYIFYHSLEVVNCDKDALSACLEVIRNQREFVMGLRQDDTTVSQGSVLTLQQYLEDSNEACGVTFRVGSFSLCDLDHDGTPEVILYITPGSLDYGPLILHYHDGTVYGFQLVMRGFSDLKFDGTFETDDGVYNICIASISFMPQYKEYRYDIFSYSRSSYDENDHLSVKYYVDHTETTQNVFESARQEQSSKPDAERYDYTEKNIEAVFSQLLNE